MEHELKVYFDAVIGKLDKADRTNDLILRDVESIKDNVEKLASKVDNANEKITKNSKDIEYIEKRIDHNWNNQNGKIDAVSQKLLVCDNSKSEVFRIEKENMIKLLDDSIEISLSKLQIKFYVAVIAAIFSAAFSIVKLFMK